MGKNTAKHLWEVKHAYYCSESNDCTQEFKSWEDFEADAGEEDLDYNLIFRFDWQEPEGEDGEPKKTHRGVADVNYRNAELKLFYIGQREGLFRYVQIDVCRADEPKIIDFLNPRLAYMMKLWAPLA